MIIIILLLLFLLILAAVGLGAYVHIRKGMREQKNYERGLKMVPLLIHLPPRSSDTEVGSRDNRDVVDETVSKAETLYDIIASTTQKGSKSAFYGQRHFSFEIIAHEGSVHFYVAVPIVLMDVVQQAILSAYPAAKLEETPEHNIFNKTGGIDGVRGGELELKEHYSRPTATFKELKIDTMQSLLNALSTLDNEDGACVQILMRPAKSGWRDAAIQQAKDKRDGGSSTSFWDSLTSFENWGQWLVQALYAPFKVPEYKESDSKDSSQKQLSGLDQALVDAIEEKTRHSGYEVLIRLVGSSTTGQRAQSIVSSLVATFALYDSPGKNGYKYNESKDVEGLATAYIMRFFAPENDGMVLNAIELATLFHFPDQNTVPTSQLERQASKQVDGPRNVPDEGITLGYNVFRGTKKKINIAINDRRRHIYVVGQTGTGKSTFLENLALQDMMEGGGFAFIDPHGDTAEKLLSMVPEDRTEDVVYFCPADMEYPLGLNLFEFDSPDEKDFLIQESLNMLYKLYDPQRQGIIGPRFERIFTNAALLLMADPQGGTFVDIPKLLIDADFMKAKLQYVKDRNVLDFWQKEWPNSQKSNEAGEVTSWVVSKFGAFLSNEMMRNIIGQTKSSFQMRDIMDNRKILLVNLSKGRSGELNSKLLGMIFVMKFQAAAMSRASIPEDDRVDFSLYVDEFQNFSTDSFADILSEARKYRLKLIIANQFTTQLTDEIRDAVFGNVGTLIAFRVGTQDADFLAKQFSPAFSTDDLQRVPNYNMIVRMLIGGVPTQSFSMASLPPLGNPNKELADAIKQLSAAKHGRVRAEVEKEIFARIQTDTKPAQQAGGPRVAAGAKQAGPQKPRSFLEDWGHKKRTNSFKAPKSPFKRPQGPPPAQVQQPQQAYANPAPAPYPQTQQYGPPQVPAHQYAAQHATQPMQSQGVPPVAAQQGYQPQPAYPVSNGPVVDPATQQYAHAPQPMPQPQQYAAQQAPLQSAHQALPQHAQPYYQQHQVQPPREV